ncbi:hypothetical protein DFH09DRAFT_1068456 [Mycena vulgaris]|nr:hypothetical protein DFH09DRAFT_1068456 [Mycena vulgaris]
MSGEANIYLEKSEYTEAASLRAEILKNHDMDQEPYRYATSLVKIAQINVTIGAPEHDVLRTLEKTRALLLATGYHAGLMYCDMVLADLHLRQGNITSSKILFQQCFDRSWGKEAETMIYCLERVGDISQWGVSDFEWASTWSVVYLAFAQKSQGRLTLNKALWCLGDVFFAREDADTAASLFIVALEGFTYMDIHRSRAECMLRLGDIASKRGNFEKTAELWTDARPLFERALQSRDVTKIDARLAAVHQDILEKHEKAIEHLSELDVPTTCISKLNPGAEQALVLAGQRIHPGLVST